MARIRQDTLVGMIFSNLVAIFIVLAAAATLHANGVTTIETAAQAAEALRPVAGRFAFLLFALGHHRHRPARRSRARRFGRLCRIAKWLGRPASLDSRPLKARLFYGTIAATTLAGALLQSVGVNPVRALYWSAVINGVLAAPLMALMMLIVTNPRAMGHLTLGRRGRGARLGRDGDHGRRDPAVLRLAVLSAISARPGPSACGSDRPFRARWCAPPA